MSLQRVIRSVRDARGNVIQKQPTAGVGQQRCMKCQRICTAQRLPNGKQVMKCGGCGATYTSKRLDVPKVVNPNGQVPRKTVKPAQRPVTMVPRPVAAPRRPQRAPVQAPRAR